VWNKEIARRAAIGTYPAQQYIAVQVENADVSRQIMPDGTVHEGMVPNIPPQARNIYQSVLVYADIRRTLHMRPLIEVFAIRAEELDTVVLAIAYQHPSIGGDADAVREIELARTSAGLSPGLDQFTVSGESMDPGIAVPVSDVKFAVSRNGDIRGRVKGWPSTPDTGNPFRDPYLAVVAGV